jgi:hypothetical protein
VDEIIMPAAFSSPNLATTEKALKSSRRKSVADTRNLKREQINDFDYRDLEELPEVKVQTKARFGNVKENTPNLLVIIVNFNDLAVLDVFKKTEAAYDFEFITKCKREHVEFTGTMPMDFGLEAYSKEKENIQYGLTNFHQNFSVYEYCFKGESKYSIIVDILKGLDYLIISIPDPLSSICAGLKKEKCKSESISVDGIAYLREVFHLTKLKEIFIELTDGQDKRVSFVFNKYRPLRIQIDDVYYLQFLRQKLEDLKKLKNHPLDKAYENLDIYAVIDGKRTNELPVK